MLRTYYLENGDKIVFNVAGIINEGMCADIYAIDNDTCLKDFKIDANLFTDIEAFKTIMKMKLNNFYEICFIPVTVNSNC